MRAFHVEAADQHHVISDVITHLEAADQHHVLPLKREGEHGVALPRAEGLRGWRGGGIVVNNDGSECSSAAPSFAPACQHYAQRPPRPWRFTGMIHTTGRAVHRTSCPGLAA